MAAYPTFRRSIRGIVKRLIRIGTFGGLTIGKVIAYFVEAKVYVVGKWTESTL